MFSKIRLRVFCRYVNKCVKKIQVFFCNPIIQVLDKISNIPIPRLVNILSLKFESSFKK